MCRKRVGMKGIKMVVYLGMPISEVFTIKVVVGSYGVLERVSFTDQLLWVRNGERNATLVMVIVMVPCFRSVVGMWDMMMWSGMVGDVENTMCSRMDSYFRCVSLEKPLDLERVSSLSREWR
ncbi:hypothetical protein TIFTF001_013681 [Ficus carica]|uniref:Uncharacterized protein n=1 Tax=Ficus carica TaxID=3494 RepID=A0AA88AI96_FICCA|nr:hypothetical protein TIFTF001_013681 [Ficus carica]